MNDAVQSIGMLHARSAVSVYENGSAAAFLVRYRVRLTVAVAAGMIVVAAARGISIHEPLNSRDFNSIFGVLMISVGCAIRSWAAGVLRKNADLAVAGPYAIVRNPLYLGSLSLIVGFSALIGCKLAVSVALIPLAALYFLQIKYEEECLSRHFGSTWAHYAAAVPRLLPKLGLPRTLGDWRWRTWLRNREYRAFACCLFALAAFEICQ